MIILLHTLKLLSINLYTFDFDLNKFINFEILKLFIKLKD